MNPRFLLTTRGRRVGWTMEFCRYPDWPQNLDLLFADATG
jgi:hypothetical protein